MSNSINRTLLAPTVIYSGLDYLVLGKRVTSLHRVPGTEMIGRIRALLSNLEAGWHKGSLAEEGTPRSSIAKFSKGGLDLLIQRDRATRDTESRSYRLLVFIRTRHLHMEAHASFRLARALLLRLGTALADMGGFVVEPGDPYLHEVHLFADLMNWELLRAHERRFVSRYRSDFEDFGKNGTLYTGFTHANALRGYLKSYQVQGTAAAVWLHQFWVAGGWTPAMGNVWRIELIFGFDRLSEFPVMDLDLLWQTGLTDTRLTVRAKPGDVRRRHRAPEAGIWKLLRTLKFVAPWHSTVPAPERLPIAASRNPNVVKGMLAWALAESLENNEMPEEDLDPEVRRVTDALLNDPEPRDRILFHLRRR